VTHAAAPTRTALTARTVAADPAAPLLDELGPGGFAWFDGPAGFVTAGAVATVPVPDAGALLAAIEHEHATDAPSEGGPRAVGALPFEGRGTLTVPAVIVGRTADGRGWRTDIGDPATALEVAPTPPSRFTVGGDVSADDWAAAVGDALARIAAGRLDKVVLARTVDVEADRPFDVRAVIDALRRTQPGCVVYADGGFVGASPELLVRKRGDAVTSRPLAGTGPDPAALRASSKDVHEHRIVVDEVVAALADGCDDVRATSLETLALADVNHLATTVTARCRPGVTITDLVGSLHPTPAVAGAPRAAALAAIHELEPVARGRYAGPCGWLDAHGDGAFVVALRCGELRGNRARLHAGAGIVAGSDATLEWAETQAKLEPMLRVLVRP